jgi:hypothetical protein
MNDKSYVTMGLCPICKKENGEILLDQRLRERFGMYTMTPNPCKECTEKYLKKGVLLLNPKNGNLVVLKTSAFKRIFDLPVPENHIGFCEQEVLDKLNYEENVEKNK